MEALQQASLLGEFYYHVTTTSFGPYVDQVGLYGGDASSGWVFKVDDASPPVGADQVQLKDGDRVLWYYATFGPTGGPPTLSVKAAAKKGCYTATAYDDSGKATSVSGVVARRLEEDGRPRCTAPTSVPGSTRVADPRDRDRCGSLERRGVRRSHRPRCSRSPSPVAAGAGASTARRRCG